MANNAIHIYLQDTNRPYSANDIMINLHNEYGKTAVQKALDQLTESGKIREKTYGKQKVYAIIQPDSNESGESELKELESEISNITENLGLVEKELKSSEAELQNLLAAPTTDVAKAKELELKETVENLKCKLKELSGNVVKVSPQELNELKKEREKFVREYRKRKRMCMDMIEAILEGYPKTKKDLIAEVGVETDEAVNMTSF